MGRETGGESVCLRLRFRKSGPARYLSQRDLVRTFERALRRTGYSLRFTRGFNPRPRLRIRPAVALGAAASAAAAEVVLAAPVDARAFGEALGRTLPQGLGVLECIALEAVRAVPLSALVWRFEPGLSSRGAGEPEGLPPGTRTVRRGDGSLEVRLPAEEGREPPGVRSLARALFGDDGPDAVAAADLMRVEFMDGR